LSLKEKGSLAAGQAAKDEVRAPAARRPSGAKEGVWLGFWLVYAAPSLSPNLRVVVPHPRMACQRQPHGVKGIGWVGIGAGWAADPLDPVWLGCAQAIRG
jgi:hypothetical protein